MSGCGCGSCGSRGGGGGGRRRSYRRKSKRKSKYAKSKEFARAEKKAVKHRWYVLNKIMKKAYKYKSYDMALAAVKYAEKRVDAAGKLLESANKRALQFAERRKEDGDKPKTRVSAQGTPDTVAYGIAAAGSSSSNPMDTDGTV